MRGKALKTMPKQRRCRITPAYAGKSPEIATVMVQPQDHPRLCGEKQEGNTVHWYETGSPPPMRGKARNAA